MPAPGAAAAAALLVLIILSTGGLLFALVACHHEVAEPTPTAASDDEPAAPALDRLGSLVPLRRALAAGTDAERIRALLASAPKEGLVGEVVTPVARR